MEFDPVTLFLWIILPYLVMVTAYFVIVFLYLRKVKKKLTEIESRLVQKIEKESLEKLKNREQKLLKMKNEIDDMLHDGNR
jgi:predicted Holliday junction resolvase-like endonuclease